MEHQAIIPMSEYKEFMKWKEEKNKREIPLKNWRFNMDNTLMEDIPF